MHRLNEPEIVKKFLGGVTLGEIPVAGSKRRSMAISLGGQLYRIGRIPANMAFVIIRDNLRLLYVAPEYRNYRYAAQKVFGPHIGRHDIDHALGRALTRWHGYWYTLVTRIERSANRSHGHQEKVPTIRDPGLNLDKFCYTDGRILRKILGLPCCGSSVSTWQVGYRVVKAHEENLTFSEALRARRALGMSGRKVSVDCLRPIAR